MNPYAIINKVSGSHLGTYAADSPEQAIRAMWDDAGYLPQDEQESMAELLVIEYFDADPVAKAFQYADEKGWRIGIDAPTVDQHVWGHAWRDDGMQVTRLGSCASTSANLLLHAMKQADKGLDR